MIVVHHLENSRSQRVLWLLEELGADYEVRRYERDKETNLAPSALKAVHPTGKSPLVEDEGRVFAETGAIVDYLVEAYGEGRLRPSAGSPAMHEYRYWMHAAEGSFAPLLVMALLFNRLETAAPFLIRPVAKTLVGGLREAYLDHTTEAVFGHAAHHLQGRDWFAGDAFSAADVMMSFPMEAARRRLPAFQDNPEIAAFVERIHARSAYARALERGGPYVYA